MNARKTLLMMTALALSGCTSNWDMQGNDPKDYYAAHPIRNKLESREAVQVVHFPAKEAKLPADELAGLRGALHGVSPLAVDAIHVQLSDSDMKNDTRKQYIAKLLHSMGYTRGSITFEPSAELARDDAEIDIAYAAVVSPDCPDWRTSPVTSYSNTYQGNFVCAEEVNLGLMVADPHDLAHGSGEVRPDSERDSKVIDDYRANKGMDLPPPWSSSGSSGGSSSSGASSQNPTASSAVASGVSGLNSGSQ